MRARMEGVDVGSHERSEECMGSVSSFSSAFPSRTHKRSKSSSDKNLDTARHATSCLGKDCSECEKKVRSHGNHGSVLRYTRNGTYEPSLKQRNSLENDVKHLQMHLHQEKSVRLMLERAIGRASSTLSPGHRHFTTQTRELIAEIELLEEEIADREQHVLSLYRSMFDHCVSEAASTRSSGTVSPVHAKSVTRKHPSIISSAFCSSKKFPLQHFHVLGRESGKSNVLLKSKGRHEGPLSGNTNFRVRDISQESKRRLPTGKRSYFARTLKDHLYQCPSKLSEELVRSMATLYCWVNSKGSGKSDKAPSPFLSRSSTSVVLSRRGTGECQEMLHGSTMEISSVSICKDQISTLTYAINNYRLLVEQLEKIDVSVLEGKAKLAFWINLYNSLLMHAYFAYGVPHSSLRRMALFHKAAYNIGGHTLTANSIEHSILCVRTHRVGRWFEMILSSAMRKKSGEEKQLTGLRIGLLASQPLVFFALCTGAFSDPMLRVYTANNVIEELEKAKNDFLQSNVVVKNSKKVFLPKILDRYAKEASISYDDLLTWVFDNIDKKLHEAIQKCIDLKSKRKASQVIEWLPYNTRFRYVFATDLVEKPSWL